MKRTIGSIFLLVLCTAAAYGGDATVDAMVTAGPNGRELTAYTADAQKLYATFKTKDVANGDKIRGVWIADEVGEAAPAGTIIDEKTLPMDGDTEDGEFSLSKPTMGWPLGKYHIEIYVNDHLTTKVTFEIKAAGKSKKDKDEDEGKSGGTSEI